MEILYLMEADVEHLQISPQTQDVNWTYIRRSEVVHVFFLASYVGSIYDLSLRRCKLNSAVSLPSFLVGKSILMFPNIFSSMMTVTTQVTSTLQAQKQ